MITKYVQNDYEETPVKLKLFRELLMTSSRDIKNVLTPFEREA